MNKGKILVVDDEENIRGSLHGILSDEGYEVILAEDGETALRMARVEAPDIILLDIWIPGIDGIQTLKLLKGMASESEVVMMSGHGAIDTAVKATKLGAFDFIEKPFSLDIILKTVSDAMGGLRRRKPVAAIEGDGDHLDEDWFCGSSEASQLNRQELGDAAKSGKSVLVICEPGSTSEMAARYIAGISPRSGGPFVHVSGQAQNGEESVLQHLGIKSKNGSTQEVNSLSNAFGGTIFIDGIDTLSSKARKKILKTLTTQSEQGSMDIIVSASIGSGARSARLYKAISDQLDSVMVRVVPLYERREDMSVLADRFVKAVSKKYGKSILRIDDGLLDMLTKSSAINHTDELYNVLELATLGSEGDTLTGEHVIIAGHEGSILEKSVSKPAKGGGVRKATKQRNNSGASSKSTASGRIPQRTLRSSVVLCGQGLHSGLNTGLILSPLPPNSGIVFWSISTGAKISASLDNVRSTEYATTLSSKEVTIKTVEHILSALHSYQITNLLIKIGDEAPIMDGSAREFCEILENGEVVDQDEDIKPIIIKEPISVGDDSGGAMLIVEPADRFSIDYFLDYPAPVGRQSHAYKYQGGAYYKETIAPARTFGFLKDMKMLEEAGLASGGKLSNVILIDSEKVINTPLRFPNEPARHKVLDLVGDLYLLGRPIHGKFTAHKSGHTQNIAMIKKINEMLVNG